MTSLGAQWIPSAASRAAESGPYLEAHADLIGGRQLDFLPIVTGADAVDDEEIAVGGERKQEVVAEGDFGLSTVGGMCHIRGARWPKAGARRREPR